jgi:hypothetical protein
VSEEGKILYDNPAFDELPVYYLAEGIFEYIPCFSKVEGGAIIKPEGGNEWQNEQKTNEFYLVVNSGCEDQLRKIISDRIKGEFTTIKR